MNGHEGHAVTGRKAHHDQTVKLELVRRLNRIEGQVRGISRMISEDVYCDNVLDQISAVTSALGGVEKMLLENHVRSCVVDQIREGRLDVIDELMTTIGRIAR